MKTKYWLALLLIISFVWFNFTKEKDTTQADFRRAIEIGHEQTKKVEQKAKEEKERKEKETEKIEAQLKSSINAVYQDNSLSTGSMPYSYCFGSKNSCSSGCSKIKVQAPYGSDVLVSLKKNGTVYRHAYIRSGGSFTFNVPNGSYQPFFYYGKGWNPNKFIKNTSCGELKGGFVKGEAVGKDDSQYLNNSILTYTLILQQNGNFSTSPSDKGEAF